MNTGAMKTALKRFGFDDSDPLLTWLNAGMFEFTDAADWSFLITQAQINVAIGANTLVLPVDYFKTMSLRHDSQGFKLEWRDPREFDEEILDYTVQGTPAFYTVIGGVTKIYPTSDEDTTMTLTYEKDVAELVDDGDVPVVPVRYHYGGIVQGAAAIGLQAENEEDRSANARANRDAAIAQALVKYSHETIDTFRQVRDVQGYGD